MRNSIKKNILLQKKYPLYKYLYTVDMEALFGKNKEDDLSEFISLSKIPDTPIYDRNFRVAKKRSTPDQDYVYIMGKVSDMEDCFQKKQQIDITGVKSKIIFHIDSFQGMKDINIPSGLEGETIFIVSSTYTQKECNIVRSITLQMIGLEIILDPKKIQNKETKETEIIFDIISHFKSIGVYINLDTLRLESAYRKIHILGPKELHIDLYEYCNTSCTFCCTNGPLNLADEGNRDKQIYPLSYYIRLFKKIERSGTDSLALGITGEPFLYRGIGNLIEYLSTKSLNIGFLTNGYRLEANMDIILKSKNITHFYINISSGDYDSFIITRPGDQYSNFLSVWKAIGIIASKRPDIETRGLYVITPQNISGIEKFLILAIKANITEIELKRVVPYHFSEKDFHFSRQDIAKLLLIFEKGKMLFKKHNIQIRENFDYIINEFKNITTKVQNPESNKTNLKKVEGVTKNCYNAYHYISYKRDKAFTCGKFCGKIGEVPELDLYKLLFEEKNVQGIIDSANDVEDFLGTKEWKQKCSRCHHIDVNNMYAEFVELKRKSENLISG